MKIKVLAAIMAVAALNSGANAAIYEVNAVGSVDALIDEQRTATPVGGISLGDEMQARFVIDTSDAEMFPGSAFLYQSVPVTEWNVQIGDHVFAPKAEQVTIYGAGKENRPNYTNTQSIGLASGAVFTDADDLPFDTVGPTFQSIRFEARAPTGVEILQNEDGLSELTSFGDFPMLTFSWFQRATEFDQAYNARGSLTVGTIRRIDLPTDVPAPGAIGLMALGLISGHVARRKR